MSQPVRQAEQAGRDGGSQQHTPAGPHPAALVGEHVEEQDAEQGDHAAHPGQCPQAEEVGQVELAAIAPQAGLGRCGLALEPARPARSRRPLRGGRPGGGDGPRRLRPGLHRRCLSRCRSRGRRRGDGLLSLGGDRVAADVGLEAHQLAVDQGKALAHAVQQGDEISIRRIRHESPREKVYRIQAI